MSTIPYQPTYQLQPKYGFRYGPSNFGQPTQPINQPPPLGLQGSGATPPPVMGTGSGGIQPQFANDPFGGGDNQAENDRLQANNQERINMAQSLGYPQGKGNPFGFFNALVPGGLFSDPNKGEKYTYGNPGTHSNRGMVFDDKGRGWDPISGRGGHSYNSPSAWGSNWLGVGTEGGMFGPESSYGKLRAHGEDPISSLLGSYDNSIYSHMDQNPGLTKFGARQSRRMGANSPIKNFANILTQNTLNASTDEFGNLPTGPVWGTNPGDYVQSDQGPLMVDEHGQMKGPNGTTVMLDGVSFVNADITKPETLNREQRVALAERTSATPNTIAGWHSGNQRGTCFPEGTQISMADNTTKNIEDIQVGDKVLAFGEDSKIVEDEVTKVHSHTFTDCCSDSLVKVTLSNDKEFVVTSNHPFYMPEHNAFKWIGLFEKGELVMTKDGMMYPVSSIETLDSNEQTVYNFEVKDTHTYIAEDLRVHNGSGSEGEEGDTESTYKPSTMPAIIDDDMWDEEFSGNYGTSSSVGDMLGENVNTPMSTPDVDDMWDEEFSGNYGTTSTDPSPFSKGGADTPITDLTDPSPFSKGGADTPITDLTSGIHFEEPRTDPNLADMLGENVNTQMSGPLSGFNNTVK